MNPKPKATLADLRRTNADLELGMSVLSAALRAEPTGQAQGWRGDVVSVAKRALRAGETLDGAVVRWADVSEAARVQRELKRRFVPPAAIAAR